MEFTTCNTPLNVGTYGTEENDVLIMYTDMYTDQVRLLNMHNALKQWKEDNGEENAILGDITSVYFGTLPDGNVSYEDMKHGQVSILTGHACLKALAEYFDDYSMGIEDPLDGQIKQDAIKKAYIMSGKLFMNIIKYFENIGQHRPTLYDLLRGSDVRLFDSTGVYKTNIYIP